MDSKETLQWYEENAEEYVKNISDKIDPKQIQEFANLLPKNAKVIDVGCASGRDVKNLVDEGLDASGIDLSGNMIRIAKNDFPNFEFYQGDFLKLPFADETFDGLWTHNSIVHLSTNEDVEQAVKEFSRVLKKKGWMHFFVKAQTGEEETAIKKDKFSNHDRFFRYFTLDRVRNLLEKHGFLIDILKQMNEADFLKDGRPDEDMILCLAQKK